MISQIKNSVFTKILWGLMGFYLLNISIDSTDPNPKHTPEDLSINDQESIVELVVEKILGYEHAIEEHDEHDTEDYNKRANVKIDLIARFTINVNISQNQLFIDTSKQQFCELSPFLTTGFDYLHTPPPKI